MLIEKHQKFISEYKKEFDIIDRIFVLKEKQDQLEYWLHDSKDDPEKNQKYLKAMRAADKELLKLNDELNVLYTSNSNGTPNVPKANSKSRYNWLKNKIETHKEAMAYWDEKLQEYSKDKKETKKKEKNVNKVRKSNKSKGKK